ncbi:glycosyltransferase family 4 protein [Nocardioides sp. YIM 152588]|uniref:glycosyltransferase family 4 protein n=1 Tax=Nocardioides sp. YIM 152588 TaxID=3158259 RepID=UPI0032E4D3C1
MSQPAGHGDPARVLHLLVPAGVDDPDRPSGGNTYDLRLAAALSEMGRDVRPVGVPVGSGAALAAALAGVPDGGRVVVDGLVGLAHAEPVARERGRLAVWLLVHLPLALDEEAGPDAVAQERRALRAAAGVLTTSDWTRRYLLAEHGLAPGSVRVARPGADGAEVAARSPTGGRLLTVGAVVPAKGQDVLVAALAGVADLEWSSRVVGPLGRAPGFAADVRRSAAAPGLGGRVRIEGPLPPRRLATAYATADLLVLPTRLETYGMVVTEALARGVPVLASGVGGVPEALGTAPDGCRPGILVPPGDPAALADALRRWLTDGAARRRLRAATLARRPGLEPWTATAASVLDAVAAGPRPGVNRSAAAPVVPT